jgi:hypothetical protein
MAVDTCPNALAMDTSDYFGEMLIKHVFDPLLKGEPSDVIARSMILEKGVLTSRFAYLSDFAQICSSRKSDMSLSSKTDG